MELVRHGSHVVSLALDRFRTKRDDGESGTIGAAVEWRNDDAPGFTAISRRAIAGRPIAVIRDDAVLRARQHAGFSSFRFRREMRADVILVDAIRPSIFADDVATLNSSLNAGAMEAAAFYVVVIIIIIIIIDVIFLQAVKGVPEATDAPIDEIVDGFVEKTRRSVFQLAIRPRRFVPTQPLTVAVADFEAPAFRFRLRQLRAVMRVRLPFSRGVDAFHGPDLNAAVAASGRLAIAPSTGSPRVCRRRMNRDLDGKWGVGN